MLCGRVGLWSQRNVSAVDAAHKCTRLALAHPLQRSVNLQTCVRVIIDIRLLPCSAELLLYLRSFVHVQLPLHSWWRCSLGSLPSLALSITFAASLPCPHATLTPNCHELSHVRSVRARVS